MKILDTIDNLNLQLDDPNCQELSKKLKRKYSILGNLLFYLGLLISIASLIVIITISIYAIVNKVMQIKDNMKQLQTFSLIDTPSFSEAKKKN